jgi:hypothetical protein
MFQQNPMFQHSSVVNSIPIVVKEDYLGLNLNHSY